MGKPNDHQTLISSKKHIGFVLCLSILMNFSLIGYNFYFAGGGGLSWSRGAAEEAELVAAISCSGHGRAYLDGEISGDGGLPGCECNTCYGGSDCSQFDPSCSADADGGNPLFLEPFWMQRAAASAVLVAGHHRMGYSYNDSTFISYELVRHIRKLHSIVGNAITDNKSIIFGAGSTQLLNAAVHALSSSSSSSFAAGVVASPPFYPVYELQTEFFDSKDFQFQGDASTLLRNKSSSSNPDGKRIIEFVTSPNNPDGKLNKAILQGQNHKSIYDRAYFWPHFTPIAIPTATDDNPDVVIFTLSKLTGHAGSRFGWAIVKDEEVYGEMVKYLQLNTMGDSRETQLRALKLLKTVIGGRVSVSGDEGSSIFEFGYKTMKKRWEGLKSVVETSKRFSLQDVSSQYCRFFGKEREASPAYAWLKCEGKEDIGSSCYEVLRRGGIIGREGIKFSASDRYVRLSLIKTEDDFNMLLHKLRILISSESQPEHDTYVLNDVDGSRQAFPRKM